MKKVSRDEFYKTVGRLNVHPQIMTNYPYTSDWRLQSEPMRQPVGRSVDRVEGGVIVTDYYVAA